MKLCLEGFQVIDFRGVDHNVFEPSPPAIQTDLRHTTAEIGGSSCEEGSYTGGLNDIQYEFFHIAGRKFNENNVLILDISI
jgi:hypothetical protein